MGIDNNSRGQTLVQNNISQDHLPNTEENPKKKRRRVTKACINCRKSHVACDEERPCRRCIKLGIESSCVDVPRRKRSTGKRKRDDSFSNPRYQPPIQPMPSNPSPLFSQPNQQPPSFSALSASAASLPPVPPANPGGIDSSQLFMNREYNINNNNINNSTNNNNNPFQDLNNCTCENDCFKNNKNLNNNNNNNNNNYTNNEVNNNNNNINFGFPSPPDFKSDIESLPTPTSTSTSNNNDWEDDQDRQNLVDQFAVVNNDQFDYSSGINSDVSDQLSLSPLFSNIDSSLQFFDPLATDTSSGNSNVNQQNDNYNYNNNNNNSLKSETMRQINNDSSSPESLVLSSPECCEETNQQKTDKDIEQITRDIESLRFLGHKVESMIGTDNNTQAWQSVQELLHKVDHLSLSFEKVVSSDSSALVPKIDYFRKPKSPIPIVTWQTGKLMLSCNKEFRRLLGYEGDPSFGPGKTTVGDILHPLNYYHVFHFKKKSFPSETCQMERDAVMVTKSREYLGVRFIFEITYAQYDYPVFLQRILEIYSSEQTAQIINRYAKQISQRTQVELLGQESVNGDCCAFIPPLRSSQQE